MRSLAGDGFIFEDRSKRALVRGDVDTWVASLRALADLAPDVALEVSRVLAWNRHGVVAVSRVFGTVPENLMVSVVLTAGDRIERYEPFAVADAERAVARFEELCRERGT